MFGGLEGSSLINTISSEIGPAIKALSDAGIITRQGAVVDHQESTVEYQFHMKLGDLASRSQIQDQLLRKIQGLTQGGITFDNAIGAWGFGLPLNEDLTKLGIISFEGDKVRISLSDMVNKVQSNLAVVSVKMNVPMPIREALLTVHFSQNTKKTELISESYFEVGLDYANLWLGSFDSFEVKNIAWTFNLLVMEESIESAVPQALKKRIFDALRKVSIGDKNAMRFLAEISRSFAGFANQDTADRLRRMISLDQSARAEVVDIIPTLESYEFGGLSLPVLLPGKVAIRLRGSVPQGEKVMTGNLRLDLKAFNNLIQDIALDAERSTKRIEF
jgi:hypothetical protein